MLIDAGEKHIENHINRRGSNPVEDLKLIREYKKIIRKINPNISSGSNIVKDITSTGTYLGNLARKIE